MTSGRIDMCLAAKFFSPEFSGAAVRFQRYAPGLRTRGIDMRVFTGSQQKNHRASSLLKRRMASGKMLPIEYQNGLAIQRVQLTPGTSYFIDSQYARAMLNYCQQPATRSDLIHLISASQHWLPHYFSFRRLGLPIVQSHSLLLSLSENKWKTYLHRLLWRRLHFQLADCVVTASVIGRDALRNIGVTRRIEVISNGLDLIRFRPVASREKKEDLRSQLGLDPNAEIILFVGALIERKGIDILIRAWRSIARKCPRAYLMLVGPNKKDMRQDMYSAEFQDRIETGIAGSGARDRVIITGRVENVEDYYRASDVFVFLSHREGMSNAILEAFGCGVATILTPFIGLSTEYGQPGEHFILVEREPEALAQATIAFLQNPGRQQQFGYNARKWVEEQFDIECSLDQYADLYRELVDRSKNGRLRGL